VFSFILMSWHVPTSGGSRQILLGGPRRGQCLTKGAHKKNCNKWYSKIINFILLWNHINIYFVQESVEVQNEKYSPGCQFNVNKTPGYNNAPFFYLWNPHYCGQLSPHFSILIGTTMLDQLNLKKYIDALHYSNRIQRLCCLEKQSTNTSRSRALALLDSMLRTPRSLSFSSVVVDRRKV